MNRETKIISSENVIDAANSIKCGGLVVFPTETVYGLGADALNPKACMDIFKAKGRPADNPLIVHIADVGSLKDLAKEIPDEAKVLMDRFWPGPLTMIFKKKDSVCDTVTAGLKTVAVRFPSNETAIELIKNSTGFIAAPSANLSGSPSPTSIVHVTDDMMGRVDYIIDDEGCEIGIESTVLDVSGDVFKILRPGAVTFDDIHNVIGDKIEDIPVAKNVSVPQCPGMKYTHYSPKADVTVVCGSNEATSEYILNILRSNNNGKIGILSYGSDLFDDAYCVIDAGCDMREYAKGLYYNLREFDRLGVDKIYAQFCLEEGIGIAVKNRLFKSAGNDIIYV